MTDAEMTKAVNQTRRAVAKARKNAAARARFEASGLASYWAGSISASVDADYTSGNVVVHVVEVSR